MASTTAHRSTTPSVPDRGTGPLPKRRRPRQVAAGLAVLGASCVGGAVLYGTLADTEPVIGVAQHVERGALISEADLAVIQLGTSSGLDTISGDLIDDFIGTRAAVDLTPGTVLTPRSTTTSMVPVGDAALVPVAVPLTRLPNEPLLPGDTVRIVQTPEQGQKISEDPPVISATVSTVGAPDASGLVVVDVLVAPSDAAVLTVTAALGRVALVLDSREADTGAR